MNNQGFELNEVVEINGTKKDLLKDLQQYPTLEIEKKEYVSDLLYGIEDVPPWYMCLFLGFQHYLEMIGATVACPFFLTPALCMDDDDPDRANIINTLVFMSGIITLFQSTFGTRLPIVQGGSFSYLIPALSILSLKKWECPENIQTFSDEEKTEVWQVRMRELQGAIICAAFFETMLAATGVIGMILKYITPLTVAPAITLIGISLFKHAAKECAKNWWISGLTFVLLIIFSQHFRNIKLRNPFKKTKNDKFEGFPVFQVFPVLMSLAIVWALCGILTATNVFKEGDAGRTDAKIKLFTNSPWFYIPLPFQWGWPTVSAGAVLGVMSGVMASMVESIGDYYACAKISNAPVPNMGAMNRGIFMEGFGCVLSGFWGSGNGSTSYSNNIGTISVTRVASRRVIQTAGFVMISLSLIGKAGAVFVGLPDPIVGGMFCFIFPLIMAVGIGILQEVDLNSTRNIFVVSFSIFFGLMISEWVKANPDVIDTGYDEPNNIIRILLGTGMFLAGFTGFILDNTIPGTPEERGLNHFLPPNERRSDEIEATYDFPFGMNFIKRFGWLKYVPISPTYEKH